ncbi:tetratricopeptide repeat protein [Aliikangiella sp. IMCC44653]
MNNRFVFNWYSAFKLFGYFFAYFFSLYSLSSWSSNCFEQQLPAQLKIQACQNQIQQYQEKYNNAALDEPTFEKFNKLIVLLTAQGSFTEARELIATTQLAPLNQYTFKNHFDFLRSKGILNYRQGELAHALDSFSLANLLAESQQDHESIAKSLSDKGTVYLAMMQYPEALGAYQLSLKLKQKLNQPKSIAITLNNIGNVYRKLHDWSLSEQFYQQALAIYQSLNDTKATAHTQENIGLIHLQNHSPQQAVEVFLASYALFKASDEQHAQLRVLILLAQAHLQMQELDKAASYLQQAEQIDLLLGTSAQSTKLKLNLGQLLSLKGQYQQAQAVLLSGLNFAIDKQDKENEILILQALTEHALRFNQWKNAQSWQAKLTQQQLAQYQQNFNLLLAQKRALFEYEQQQKQITILNRDNQIKDLKIANQTQSMWLLITMGLLLITITAWFAAIQIKKRRALKQALTEKSQFHHQQVKQLGASFESLKNVFGKVEQALLLFNNKNQLIFINQRCSDELEIDNQELLATPLDSIIERSNQDFWKLFESQEELNQQQLCDVTIKIGNKEFTYDLLISSVQREEAMTLIALVDQSASALNLTIEQLIPEASLPQQLVDLMLSGLTAWEEATQSSRIELAEQSGIWRVSIDDGRLRTRSLDKYLTLKTLPKRPRWREVLRTAHFVLAHCELKPETKVALEDKLNRVTQLIKAKALL